MMILPIEKEQVPYSFEIELANEVFMFEVYYNEYGDFFTIDCLINGEVLVYGHKLMLEKPLFAGLSDHRLPKVNIVPKDRSGEAKRITFENLSETVFLYVE